MASGRLRPGTSGASKSSFTTTSTVGASGEACTTRRPAVAATFLISEDPLPSSTIRLIGSALVAVAFAGLGLAAPSQNYWGHVIPLMGLMGTVWGMITVFEVMSFTGTGNARAMAGGVYKATLPTMAGLVAALSGLYPSNFLERKAATEVERIEDMLQHEDLVQIERTQGG